MIKKIKFTVLLLFLFVSYSRADIGIGLGWPYLSLKYNFSPKIASEFRFAAGEGINVFAGRGYYNFYKLNKLNAFTGLEVGYITFDTLDMKGSGFVLGPFIGGEYFITNKLSLALDLYPAFISLSSDDFSIDGFEFVLNLGIYYYFSPPFK